MADDDFQRWASCPDDAIDLARAALAIARDEYPYLDVAACVSRLDAMARAAQAGLGTDADPASVLAVLDRQLFDIEGFTGNADDYYDPRNSYLNDVLERRTGIPITLSVVYLEVGWRLGLPLKPVGFPGHFLVGLAGSRPCLLVDPYHGGRRPGEAALLQMLSRVVGARSAAALLPRALTPVPRREVIARMLRNLKSIHVDAGDWARALRVTDRLATLLPDVPAELRDRARLYERLEAHRAAYDDYRRYLARAPRAEDADAVRARLEALRPLATRLN
jgi:regulator of sirC expression with transglutaminase-like and TPR domain